MYSNSVNTDKSKIMVVKRREKAIAPLSYLMENLSLKITCNMHMAFDPKTSRGCMNASQYIQAELGIAIKCS